MNIRPHEGQHVQFKQEIVDGTLEAQGTVAAVVPEFGYKDEAGYLDPRTSFLPRPHYEWLVAIRIMGAPDWWPEGDGRTFLTYVRHVELIGGAS